MEEGGDGREMRVASLRQRLVEVRRGEARGLGKVGHTFGTGDVTQCCVEQLGIAIFEDGIEIGRNVLFGFQVVGSIPTGRFEGHIQTFCAIPMACAMSRSWLRLSPPQGRITTVLPRPTKYSR